MKQKFMKKISIIMCVVMLFCATPLNMFAFGVDEKADTSTSVTETTGTEVEDEIIEVLKKVIEVLKKVVVAIADYLEAQENPDNQEQKPVEPEDDKEEKDLSETGIAGYLFDAKEKCFYTASDPWQRIVGYNELFDVFSEFALIDFDTIRFKFKYKNEDWMIQIWKGQYGLLFYGAEIGLYNKPLDRKIPHYDAVEDHERIKMSMDFYEYEKGFFKKAEWKKKFSRPYDYYWWCTGFIPGNRDDEFDKLRVDARFTATDYDMLSALTESIGKQGIAYKVKGLDIILSYH